MKATNVYFVVIISLQFLVFTNQQTTCYLRQTTSLTFRHQDLSFISATIANKTVHSNFECAAFCRISNAIAIVYRDITKKCTVFIATTTCTDEYKYLNYEQQSLNDKLYLHDNLDGILTSIKPSTMIQQRIFGNVSFERNWGVYEAGFGDNPGGDFWTGLSILHTTTTPTAKRIRLEMQRHDGDERYYCAEYSSFQVGNAAGKYILSVSGYDVTVSNAGDNGILNLNGLRFSAQDLDLDTYGPKCTDSRGNGAFWYGACGGANPNGRWTTTKVFSWSKIYWMSLDSANSMRNFRIWLYI